MIKADIFHNVSTATLRFPLPSDRHTRQTKLSPTLLFHNNHSLPSSYRFELLRFSTNTNSKVIRWMNSDNSDLGSDMLLELEDSDVPVELCHTHTLPPALTLEHGLIKIKEEIEKLKADPPCCKSGILRFQVAVPPNTKALSWLYSQPKSLEAFPQFYLSKMNPDNPTLDSYSFNGVLGLSGIGAAVYFMGSSCAPKEWNSIKRYLSVDSPLIRAYAFVGINFGTESSSIKHENDSFYLFIPQIELDEYESSSLLAATLAWNNSPLCTFDKAICSFELLLYQAIHHFSLSKEARHNDCINSILKKSDLVEDKNIQMVYINADSFVGEDTSANHLELEEASISYQFCFRLSPTLAITCNMLDNPSEMSYSLQNSANINALWASLIIEECTRLGLTYFCIAPGSRSSPLAVAASTHPHTTCISCFDERSLAFHAVGYARGSYRPAVVITSSGTAVSNLLPAVVEASQDFVPLLLLTADRPPELLDAGSNQAINQVNHFGSFVRFFFSLPPPTDLVPARMVLTTVDSAVYWATNTPYGPVHVNCPFREPLADTPQEWMLSCLKGLDFWMSRAKPFTKYIGRHHSHACNDILNQNAEVLNLIQCANKGLLLIGAIHTEDDMWATLLLAKHLSWPTVADILSGLRLRKVLTMFPEIEEKSLFLDHLDHALLSDSVRGWAQAEVIVQIGSRITSKRIAQMLEACSPCSYIMVDKHPYRHDPSHIVTHRIQSTVTEFVDSVLKVHIPRINSKWSSFLKALNMMVAWEMAFQIHSENSLTEPHVAQVISEALPSDAALFIGNGMVIRDADMYGCGWAKPATSVSSIKSSWELQYLGRRTAGNRGASGIDGLLSTAIGFAVGCNKRVFCLIGDISFLHDTNGLAILNQRTWRKPMTILVINNHGGAIFSLLPIADRTDPSVLNRYFYTSHNISISKLCEAHSVYHIPVRTKMELQHALLISQQAHTDCIIEVESCIEDNATFHSTLKKYACQAADTAISILSRFSVLDHSSADFFLCRIDRMEYSLYRIQLSAPPTSTPINDDCSRFHREGFLLALYLDDGSIGFGEVAPLEIHKENLLDVEDQLRFLLHVIQGAKMSYLLPLLRGSFSSWIRRSLGIPPHSIFPSVRCGLEMAILNAIAARQGSSLSNLLLHHECSTLKTQLLKAEEIEEGSSKVQICALLDSNGTPQEVAHIASKLVKEGFTAIKLKVGRRANPFEDAAVIQAIREKVGHQIKLRADANQKWTYEEACQFGSCVTFCDLQYIEEPVHLEDDIIRFCEETGLPVALDETIDNIRGDPLIRLAKFIHRRIVAVVIKPSVVGGFENAALIAKWAQQQDKMAVVSAAFESSLSLSAYIQFAHYLEQQNIEICKVKNEEVCQPVAHGLGTYRWLREDVTTKPLNIRGQPYNDVVEAHIDDAARLLQNFKVNPKTIQRSYTEEQVRQYQLTMDCEDYTWSFDVREAGTKTDNNVLIFLHDFLGTGEDWIPIMKAISTSARCISINLPGHGGSQIQSHADKKAKQEPSMSLEVIANVLCKIILNITSSRVVVVGFSMGARIALYMALRCSDLIDGAVVISGSPGLKDVRMRRSHIAQDDSRARSLTNHGLLFFLDTWYSGELWASLRAHPRYEQFISSRAQHNNVHALAKALSDLSIGRQPSLWEDLKRCTKPMLFIVGEKDKKFKEIARKMFYEIGRDDSSKEIHEMVEVPDCGNAVHLENPLPVINALRQFLTKLNKRKSASSN